MSADYSSSTSKSIFSSVISGSPIITTVSLNGENYTQWATAVELRFKEHLIYDHLTKQASDISTPDKEAWEAADVHLCLLLWKTIHTDLFPHFSSHKTCYEVWEKARLLYAANDIQRFYGVITDLLSIRKQDQSISSYLVHIQNVRNKFLEILSLSTDIETQEKNYDKLFMLLTLAGLPDDLDYFRQQMLTSASTPSMDDVFSRLLRVSQPVMSISECSFKLNGKTANVAQTNSSAPSLETPNSLDQTH